MWKTRVKKSAAPREGKKPFAAQKTERDGRPQSLWERERRDSGRVEQPHEIIIYLFKILEGPRTGRFFSRAGTFSRTCASSFGFRCSAPFLRLFFRRNRCEIITDRKPRNHEIRHDLVFRRGPLFVREGSKNKVSVAKSGPWLGAKNLRF